MSRKEHVESEVVPIENNLSSKQLSRWCIKIECLPLIVFFSIMDFVKVRFTNLIHNK
ncbi:MAG: hypothetical protein ACJAV5_002120 [Vicingaceae bacterium]|jgi:hypothetical protein